MKNNNDTIIYSISKQIKRLQKQVSNNNLERLSLLIGFMVNLVIIIINLFDEDLTRKGKIIISAILSAIVVMLIILMLIKIIKNNTQVVIRHSLYEQCTKFDEETVPHVKCALEYVDKLSDLKSQKDSCEYKLNVIELKYHVQTAISGMNSILREPNNAISKVIIKKDRVDIMIEALGYMISLPFDYDEVTKENFSDLKDRVVKPSNDKL